MAESSQSVAQIVRKLSFLVIGMFGFGYLMVPIYDILCEVTGLNGKTGVVDASEAKAIQVDLSREITVEFVANLNQSASWEFKPDVVSMKVHPGKTYTTTYYARNTASRDVVGQAVPSVSPREASRYFNKTECFCFTNQLFAAKESKHMPLTFVVDPNIPKTVKTLTLSYTFFDTGDKAGS